MSKHRAVFLDRDGTICEEVGYLNSVHQMRLIPRSAEAIRRLNEHGFKVVVITNQSGVARGLILEQNLNDIHTEMIRQLREEGASLDGIYYCPHHPTEGNPPYLQECTCRKPATGLLEKAAADLNLNLSSSYMVGDHFSDIECGRRVGAKTVLLLTGHGRQSLERQSEWPSQPDYLAADLYEAVNWILQQEYKAIA